MALKCQKILQELETATFTTKLHLYILDFCSFNFLEQPKFSHLIHLQAPWSTENHDMTCKNSKRNGIYQIFRLMNLKPNLDTFKGTYLSHHKYFRWECRE